MEINKTLKITNLSHCYKNGKSIKNINLDVFPGEVVCVLGPSGCGKTTLLRLIAGFEEPTGGQIKIGKDYVFGKSYVPTEKRFIGMLFQDIALFPHLSVKNNIGFFPKPISKKNDACKIISIIKTENRIPNPISRNNLNLFFLSSINQFYIQTVCYPEFSLLNIPR